MFIADDERLRHEVRSLLKVHNQHDFVINFQHQYLLIR